MTNKLSIDIPKPDALIGRPIWDGENFVVGDYSTPVLEFSENFDGWSDDLSSLHEVEAGSNHPIDIASRRDAIAQIIKNIQIIGGEKFSILEVGCSSGYMLEDLKRCFPLATIVGSDVVKEPLYSLAKRLPGIPLFRFDILKTPFHSPSFDVVLMLNVLEHIENDIDALKQANKMIKDDGLLILEVPAVSWLYDDYDAALSHFRRYDYHELKLKLEEAGFEVIRKSSLGFLLFPAFVIFKLLGKIRKRRDNVLRKNIKLTKNSSLFNLLCKFETKYLSEFSLPIGIRINITCRKLKGV